MGQTGLLDELKLSVEKAARFAFQNQAEHASSVKPDGSIVTDIDVQVEEMLRSELSRMTPGATIWGEELGFEPGDSGQVWLIDPIDGTSNYSYGLPLWGVSVGLVQESRLELGVVALPGLGATTAASRGKGATENGGPMPMVKSGPVLRHELVGAEHGNTERFGHVSGKRRHIGSFVVEAYWVASGKFRAMVSTKCALYDAAASIVVAREVGNQVVNSDGTEFDESQWLRPVKCGPFAILPPA